MGRMLFLMSALVVFGTACGQYVNVSAQKDLEYQFRRDDSLLVYIPNDVSVSEKNLHIIASRQLKESGFNVVSSIKDARLLVTLKFLKEKIRTPVYTSPFPYRHFRGSWDMDPFFPYPRHYSRPYYVTETLGIIHLQLFNAREFESGRRVPLWEGEVSGDEDLLSSRGEEFIKPLVLKLGQSFQGRVKLESSGY